MDPASSLPAVAALLAAMATAHLIVRRFGAPPAQGRFVSIDGLRGYLAFAVFLHHSCIWYFYMHHGEWRSPPSHLYTHFGESGVELFFMITGFLFFSKLIDARTRGMDWGRLFVSRIFRLTPLYLFAMLSLFLIVALLSGGALVVPLPSLIKSAIRWLGFTVLGSPDVNGVSSTNLIIARVNWSLPYEWFFYFSLPVLALTVRVRPPVPYLIVGVLCLVGLYFWGPKTHYLLTFLGGIAASFLVRIEAFRKFAATRVATVLLVGCLAADVYTFASADGIVQLLLLSAAFCLIAGGNSIFGILVSPVSRTLGEMAYSIYLLHGMILFVTFTLIMGTENVKSLSPTTYWLLVIGISPILIMISYCTFRLIEQPGMQSKDAVTAWLRSRIAGGRAPA